MIYLCVYKHLQKTEGIDPLDLELEGVMSLLMWGC